MASKNTSIALSERHQDYLRRKVESGEFASTSEVIRDALRRAEERDLRMAALNSALQEGLDSGIAQGFEFDAWMDEQFPEPECQAAE